MLRPRVARLHYHILTQLLYGTHEWLTRHAGGSVTVRTAAMAEACQTRSDQIHTSLELLYAAGLLQNFRWHNHYFIVWVRPPEGMALTVGPLTGNSHD